MKVQIRFALTAAVVAAVVEIVAAVADLPVAIVMAEVVIAALTFLLGFPALALMRN